MGSLAAQWVAVGLINSTQRLTSCSDGLSYLGGPGLQTLNGYFERTYTNLVSHDIIYFGFRIIVGGAWQSTHYFSVQFDNGTPKKFYLATAVQAPTIICSLNHTIGTYVVGRRFHTANSLTMKVTWSFQGGLSPLPFIGMKDLRITFVNKTTSDIEDIYLTTGNLTIPDSAACSGNKYYNALTTSCASCNSACENCFGAAATQCYEFSWGSTYTGTVFTDCSGNCNLCGGTPSQCYLCWGGSYVLDTDHVCKSSCTSPYVSMADGARNKCIRPCTAGQFMLYNETCVNSCGFPLIQGTDPQGSICSYPCGLSANMFLYWNGSCLTNCSYYQRENSDRRFCDICPPGLYMYDDGVCRAACSLNSTTIGGSNFCSSGGAPIPPPLVAPAAAVSSVCGSNEYLYPNASCSKFCPPSFIRKLQNGSSFCELYFSHQDMKEIDILLLLRQVSNAFLGISTIILSLINSKHCGPIFLAMIADMLQYLKYLEINYPSKLQYIFDMDYTPPIEMIVDTPQSFTDLVPDYLLPGRFQRYQPFSSFMVNFWKDEIVLGSTVFALLLTYATLFSFKKFRKISSLLLKLKSSLKWNFIMMLFISYYGEIVLFSSFDIRTNDFSTTWLNMSFFFCMCINFFALFLFQKIVRVILAVKKKSNIVAVHPQGQMTAQKPIFEDYAVVFHDFKHDSMLKIMYVPIFVFRICIFYFAVAYLFSYPLIQMILLTIVSASMILYISVLKPLKNRCEVIEAMIAEVTIMFVNCCVLILAILDRMNSDATALRRTLGGLVISVNFGLNSLGSFYMLFKILKRLRYMIINRRKKANAKAEAVMLKIEDGRTNVKDSKKSILLINNNNNLNSMQNMFYSQSHSECVHSDSTNILSQLQPSSRMFKGFDKHTEPRRNNTRKTLERIRNRALSHKKALEDNQIKINESTRYN